MEADALEDLANCHESGALRSERRVGVRLLRHCLEHVFNVVGDLRLVLLRTRFAVVFLVDLVPRRLGVVVEVVHARMLSRLLLLQQGRHGVSNALVLRSEA